MANLTSVVVMRAQGGKCDLLGAALADMVFNTRQEPGCLRIELNKAVDDPTTWMIYERWKDQAALDTHMQQPYTVKFIARMGDLMSEPPDIQSFDYQP